MLPVLLGEAPSKGGDRYHAIPLSGRPAQVLCRLAGIPPQSEGSTWGKWTWALYERFECRNLFERYAHATPWSVPSARRRVEQLDLDWPGSVVVCLGRRVHAAVLYLHGIPAQGFGEFYQWAPPRAGARSNGPWVIGIPHPSGLNRLLNDPAERARCGKILREALAIAEPDATVAAS